MADAVRRCSVCEHPSVLGINAAILNGKSYRAISRDFKIGSEASGTFKPDHRKVTRHAEQCLATSFQQVQKDNLDTQGAAIHARLRELEAHVDVVIADAMQGTVVMVGDTPMLDSETGDVRRVRDSKAHRIILAAVRESRQTNALVAKLAGAIPEDDNDGPDAARDAMEDPEVRRLTQQLEEALARVEQAAGRNGVNT